MANKIAGLTLTIGADTTALSTALRDVNKKSRSLQSELKEVERLLKLDPTNVDLLRQKEILLGDSVANTKEKLDKLKLSAEQAVDKLARGKIGEEQFRALQREIVKTEQSLGKLESAQDGLSHDGIDQIGKSADGAKKDVDDLTKSTDELNGAMDDAKGVGKAFAAGIGGLAVAAVGVAESTRDYREDIAKLETAFTTAGNTTEQAKGIYEDFFSIMGESDRAVEAANHLAQMNLEQEELNKWATIATGVWATFGDSLPIEGLTEAANETAKVAKVTGPLADALNWMGVSEDEFNKKLAAATTEQERQALITDTLNGLYGDAAQKYEEVNAAVIDANEAQSELNDTMARIGEEVEPIITRVKEILADLINVILDNKESVIAGLSGIAAGLIAFNVASIIMGVVGAFKAFKSAQEGATTAQALLNAVMGANPAVKIASIIFGLVTAIVVLWNTNEDFRNAVIGIWDSIKKAFGKAGEFISDTVSAIWEKIKEFGDIGKNIVEGLWNGIIGAKDWFKKKIGSFFDLLPGWVKDLLGIHSPSRVMRDEVGRYIPEGVAVGVEENMGVVKTAMQDMGTTMVNETDTIMNNLDDKIKSRSDAIAGFSGLFDAVKIDGEETGEGLLDNLQSQVDALQQYQLDMDALVSRGVTGDLLDAIKEQGPKAAAQISALTTLTEEELNEYVELFNEKSRLAALQAQKEIAAESVSIPIEVETTAVTTDETTTALNTAATNIVDTVNTGITDNVYKVAETAQKVAEEFLNKINDSMEDFYDMGRNMIDGLWDGIDSGRSGLINNIVTMLQDAVRAAKEAMDINSPSKVWAEIGGFMSQGLGVGFVDTMRSVSQQMTNAIPRDFEGTVNYATSVQRNSDIDRVASMAQSGSQFIINIENVNNSSDRDVQDFLRVAEFYRRQKDNARGGVY